MLFRSVGVSFHNELGETFQSRVKQVLLSLSHFDVHETIIGYRFGVWGPGGTVPQLVSVTVQEVSERLLVLCLSLKGTGTDSAGELTLASGSVGQVTTLGEDLLSVGVSGFVHETMMAPPGALWGKWWTVPQPSQPLSFDTNSYQAAALSIKNSL